jgi:GMP reductase
MNRILGMKYGIDDFVIVPNRLTDIESRTKECDPRYRYLNDDVLNNKLPLFTSPMSCVIDENNWFKFKDAGICTVLPRTVDINIRKSLSTRTFVAVGVKELEEIIKNPLNTFDENTKLHICLDIANGHMKKALLLCKQLKDFYGDSVTIMAGNIANPESIIDYENSGVDYVRLSIGTGNVCTTSANVGVHYPTGSLIYECNEIRVNNKLKIKLIADGGFKNFDQINKALALGADYCMLGEILAKSEEACGDIIPDINDKGHVYREYYGMSTKKAQMKMGKTPEECRTAEGIIKSVEVEYPIKKWVDNFTHYLKSAMSYTDCRNLDEFIGGPSLVVQSSMGYAAYKK